jgi:hypothetical protein
LPAGALRDFFPPPRHVRPLRIFQDINFGDFEKGAVREGVEIGEGYFLVKKYISDIGDERGGGARLTSPARNFCFSKMTSKAFNLPSNFSRYSATIASFGSKPLYLSAKISLLLKDDTITRLTC